MAKGAAMEKVKVTVNLPAADVKAGKILAIERDEDFQDLLAAGLRLILARKGARRVRRTRSARTGTVGS
jgi:hypothetical protein